MKFTIENVGPIKKAEIEFGNLTILCGKNNTGKTYITYNAFNYLDAIKYFLRVDIDKEYSEKLLRAGKISIDLFGYLSNYHAMFKIAMENWVKTESWRQMASHKDYYVNTKMLLEYDFYEFEAFVKEQNGEEHFPITKNCILHINKNQDEFSIDFTIENTGQELPDVDMLHKHLEGFLSFVFNSFFSDTFIITCERTGVACFRPSFIYSPPKKISLKKLNEYDENAPKYPRPMQKDWRFGVEFKEATIEKSFIAEEHPYILDYFSDICGGKYSLNDDLVLFEPQGASGVKLTTTESSSTVRSLMELNFYLKHKAKRHQCLIIDEPELNLHPENQRKIARLLVMLINAGIRVAITTHSDYIIREFDFMTRLYSNPDLAEKLGYNRDQLLKADRIKTYVTSPIGNTGKYELKEISVSEENGIESSSFDASIENMNFIQQAIQMGEVMSDDDFVFLDNNCGREQ